LDHFHPASAVRRKPLPLDGLSYFVAVAGFTFEFVSVEQVRECLSFFEKRIHQSSRAPIFEPEKGEWEAWHERLPATILKGSKRGRVIKALRAALVEFSDEGRGARRRAGPSRGRANRSSGA
jgi:hypothetical protein